MCKKFAIMITFKVPKHKTNMANMDAMNWIWPIWPIWIQSNISQWINKLQAPYLYQSNANNYT